jgi:hypothetical protein
MKHYEIILSPTQRELHIFVGKYDKDFAKEICGEDLDIDNDWQGAYITHEIKGYIEPIMWIKNIKSKATFIHECVHCVTDLMKATGINDDEFRAWYTEWLYNTIQDAIKLSK